MNTLYSCLLTDFEGINHAICRAMIVRLSEQQREGVSQLAKLTNRSRSYIISQAVQAYLAKNSAYLQDLQASVESIETEPSYEAGEVFAWMKTWGTEEEKPFDKAVMAHHKKP